MPQQACLNLITSTGTQVFAGLCPFGSATRTPYSITLTASVAVGATTAFVQPMPVTVRKGNRLKFASTTLILAKDALVGVTSISIEPSTATLVNGSVATTYALMELIGGESAPFQGTTEVNQTTQSESGGWISKSGSQSSWSLQWTGYIPVSASVATGYRMLQNAWVNNRYIFIERYLANGDRFAGTAVVSSFSDQLQSAGYVQYQATLEGHNTPVDIGIPTPFIVPINQTQLPPQPPTTPPSTGGTGGGTTPPAPTQPAAPTATTAGGTEHTVGQAITLTATI